MNWENNYYRWLNDETLMPVLKKELSLIKNEAELSERFYKYLEFGTGGMRGEIGAGTNRVNQYTIKRVALALGKYLKGKDENNLTAGVVIAYDNRYYSLEFAEWTAKTLASLGIKVFLSDHMRPTPQLSFLVRSYQTAAGVMITASHNPKNYNGFKIYGADGGQITLETAKSLQAILETIDNELLISTDPIEFYINRHLIEYFGESADDLYLEKLATVAENSTSDKNFGEQISISYTPLHGTGEILMRKGLNQLGFDNFKVVKDQADGDSAFSKVKLPNPEEPSAFDLSLSKLNEEKFDLYLATDPDSDRLGVVLLDSQNKPFFLDGNQIGVLLLDYLIRKRETKGQSLSNYFIVKTIVTSDLGTKIAKCHDIEVRETLTGFKFIGEQITMSERLQERQFLFGYEESFGYLIKPFVRDKDAFQAAVLMAELVLESKLNQMTPLERLEQIYQQYGYYQEGLMSFEFAGKNGQNQLAILFNKIRESKIQSIGGHQILFKEDYRTSEQFNYLTKETKVLNLPKSDVIKFIFENGWLAIRPSGTEPKCKIYLSVSENSLIKSKHSMAALTKAVNQLLSQMNNQETE